MSDAMRNIENVAAAEGYELVSAVQSSGSEFFGLAILVKMSQRKYDPERDRRHVYKAADDLQRGFETVSAEVDPKGAEARSARREEIERIYEQAGVTRIFMEAMPNGYCSLPCCLNRPWFRVTSPIGHVVIGWRKRVIAIDWTDSTVKKTGNELFPSQDVTRLERGIHAWGVEKAIEYIAGLHEVGT